MVGERPWGAQLRLTSAEVAGVVGVVGVRDSKDPNGPVPEFSRREVAGLFKFLRPEPVKP